jgi:hypothetical protein
MLVKIDLCKKIKNDILQLNQNELEEVFKIIYNSNNNYSKNNSGVLINLTWLDETILEQINNYIDFCIKSHNEINKYEIICNTYSDLIKNKDELTINPIENDNNKNKQKISSYMKFYLLKKKFMKQSSNNINYSNKNDKLLTHEEYLILT